MIGLSVVNRLSNSRSSIRAGARTRLQREQIDDVDEAQLQVRQPLAQDARRRPAPPWSPRRRSEASTTSGVLARVRARSRPDADALGAVHGRLVRWS
jgi:hypothetical protein